MSILSLAALNKKRRKPVNFRRYAGALERTRTSTPKGHRPSTYRVCQFRHQGNYHHYTRMWRGRQAGFNHLATSTFRNNTPPARGDLSFRSGAISAIMQCVTIIRPAYRCKATHEPPAGRVIGVLSREGGNMSKILSPKAWYLVGIGAVALVADGARRLVKRRRQMETAQPAPIQPEQVIPVTDYTPPSGGRASTKPAPAATRADDLTAIKGI